MWNCLLERKLYDSERLIVKTVGRKAETLAIKRSCKMKSKAFERSVNVVPLILTLSKLFRYFSVITQRRCCALKPLQDPHCHFESISFLRVFNSHLYWDGTSCQCYTCSKRLPVLFACGCLFLFQRYSHANWKLLYSSVMACLFVGWVFL